MRQLRDIVARNRAGSGEALPSVCSAHPDVVAASALLADELDAPLLIEATSNQVNQFGGYTGMTPADFVAFVSSICRRLGIAEERVLFGGDHLGPQVWRGRSADIAMGNARALVAAYVKAGFAKIHLDCSEGCAGEPAQVSNAVSAGRAADLAGVCEQAADDPSALSYIYGTEVPPPGGARADADGQGIDPTGPQSACETIEAHRHEFENRGLEAAWSRAVGLVVQPGLEFAADHVHRFDLALPDHLSPVLDDVPGQCFEAHSTDYQEAGVFPALARRHFAVLKVGPALTFAYRQAIYALEGVAAWVSADRGREPVPSLMERLMIGAPSSWSRYYEGSDDQLRLLRHFSYADRIRYYWALPEARAAVGALFASLPQGRPGRMILSQFLAPSVLDRAEGLEGKAQGWARALVWSQVQDTLAPYFFARQR